MHALVLTEEELEILEEALSMLDIIWYQSKDVNLLDEKLTAAEALLHIRIKKMLGIDASHV